jgi:transcriptional regulator with XRE-family HTH domain
MIGDKIKQRREEINMTAAELARQAGISKGYLYSIEEGTTKHPSAEIVYSLAIALATSVSDLLGHTAKCDNRELPHSLIQFAEDAQLPPADIYMLSQIFYRGRQPEQQDDWRFIYEAIRRTLA